MPPARLCAVSVNQYWANAYVSHPTISLFHRSTCGLLHTRSPQHRLATITADAVGLPRRRIYEWAIKYGWWETE